jgi:hypothetical protein
MELCAGITCGSTRKTVNLHVELVSDEFCPNFLQLFLPGWLISKIHIIRMLKRHLKCSAGEEIAF